MKKKMKLCITASSGGHLDELMSLHPFLSDFDCFLVTEKTSYHVSDAAIRTYYLKQMNRREKLGIFYLIWNVIYSILIIVRERPKATISLGALATIPISILTKLFHGKLIYIESFANTYHPTSTGKLIYRFADRFYVQWDSLLSSYPKAVYAGKVY